MRFTERLSRKSVSGRGDGERQGALLGFRVPERAERSQWRRLTAVCSVVLVQPPTGTVTFPFTDIEGSTRLWEERPDEMRAALAEHDAIVRSAIEAHGGYVFSTGGDGFAAASARATVSMNKR